MGDYWLCFPWDRGKAERGWVIECMSAPINHSPGIGMFPTVLTSHAAPLTLLLPS